MRTLISLISLCLLSLGCDTTAAPPETTVAVDVAPSPDAEPAFDVADSLPSDLPPDLPPDLPTDTCPVPQGPCLPVLHLGAALPFTAQGLPLEVGVGFGAAATEPSQWTDGDSLVLDTLGPQVLFARVAGCGDGPTFACATEVREAYSGPASGSGSDAVAMDSEEITAWAAAAVDYDEGAEVDAEWTDPAAAVGPATGSSLDILCLGRGGRVTLSFSPPFGDGPGPDLAVFENSFQEDFLELAYVEVSTDGEVFVRFDSISLTPGPVASFGTQDPAGIQGLAGTFAQGFGTPFDLATLSSHPAVLSGDLSLDTIGFVRIVDVVGDGGDLDSLGTPIYDPYPTVGSAGFDLDAVAVLGG